MNILIQNIAVLILFGLAIGFLIKKFFLKPQVSSTTKKTPGACSKSGCGCQ